jgi:glycosyltransferase involved in cell wall biosynthesis
MISMLRRLIRSGGDPDTRSTDSPPGKTRVLFIVGNSPPPPRLERMQILESSGDYETHMVYWLRADSNLTIPFTTSIPSERFTPVDLPDPRGNLLRRVFLTLRFAWAIRREIRRVDPTVAHVYFPDMLAAMRVAAGFRNRLGVVYEIPDLPNRELGGVLIKGLRWLMRRADAVFIHSPRYLPDFLDRYRLVPGEHPVVYTSVCPLASRFENFTKRNSDYLMVGYIGHYRSRQQIQNLVEAAASVRGSGRDVRVVFAGTGMDLDLVEALAGEHGFVENRGPFDYQTEVPAIYEDVDIIFSVYSIEVFNWRSNLGRRFSEGILMGIPAICARGSYMGDIAEEEGYGWVVDDESVDDLISVMTDSFDNRSILEERGRTSERLRSEHSLESRTPAILEAYQGIVEKRAGT